MDDARFDALAKVIGQRSSRRQLLRGLLGLGGGAVAATVIPESADAQWSVQVCLPNSSGGYTLRLVPKSSVPLYQRQYGAVLPENGDCPCIPNCSAGVCGGSDGCGGTCLTGTCSDGKTCRNGGCFTPCSFTDDCPFLTCPNCQCLGTRPGANPDGSNCSDTGTFIGTCASTADCPAGSVCSALASGDSNKPNVCVRPCCP